LLPGRCEPGDLLMAGTAEGNSNGKRQEVASGPSQRHSDRDGAVPEGLNSESQLG
jgi:hypothetical protein